jgi:hypothetical protein
MHNISKNDFYRNLRDEEIGQLINQGCYSPDWNLVKVCPDFSPDHIENVRFTGHIRLNSFHNFVKLIGGLVFIPAFTTPGCTTAK